MDPVMYPEQAKDQVIHQKSYNICGNHFVRFNRKVKSAFLSLQLTLMTLQAKLGYVLIGILGEKCLRQYGYPHICVLRILHHILDMAGVKVRILKSDNLQYNTVGRWVDGMIVPPSDGAMFILIDWE